jgi:hypothetical protein
MEIKEIKKIIINEESFCLSKNHLVNVYGLNDKSVKIFFKEEEIMLNFQFSGLSSIQICSEKELCDLLENLGIQKIDISILRLKIIDTKKWGRKPVYSEGADSICFCCYNVIIDNRNFIIIYNTSGTKAIEYIYIHGIWSITNDF